ncbi:MAG TPA: bacillithiol system redox-active protein YtxJ [Planctomycetes bacterium]|nr:bacillithiol system redox-active protein YtxJ [Planctomycetota bacterium]
MIITLAGQDHVEQLLAGVAPVWILKHSNTCPTSAAALDEVESFLSTHPDDVAGMVVVQLDRPLSNWIATRLGRVHQSPQLFLMQRGKVAWSASHWSITAAAMATERGRLV